MEDRPTPPLTPDELRAADLLFDLLTTERDGPEGGPDADVVPFAPRPDGAPKRADKPRLRGPRFLRMRPLGA
ncbi:hypothetical protein [Conexibacter sp. SYSU D00693]|uniref:hypothetical protein n=1 Tax=Conexibacter sp. SYSU D00693 TaxID=2812560 RepID=UPI00196AAA27|nr:hypothetical protein [Conexibacter sp. SYSU D00693]